MKNFIDLHTHTDNSPDGNHSTMYLCESAVEHGLKAIAFTDHCECDVFKKDNYDRIVRQSFFEMSKAAEAYKNDLIVLKGIELGEPHYEPAIADAILSEQSYDFVLGSLHNLRGREDFYYYPTFDGLDLKALMDEYYDENIALAEWGKFDSIAHITYPIRYFFQRSQIMYDLTPHKEKIDTLLSLLAEKDIALEINTKGLRAPVNLLCPDFETIKRFRELGGKRITIGSDAHYADELGAGALEAEEAAKAAGFTCKMMYQNREPIEVPFITQ